ncbi:MAG: tetratricopeptide repeat protein [Nitrospinae bacterium]|nr:tetratricopeptide repeat protein [Nitrospinota bacterium]MBL7020726.1 tetratricopeptide repeat protein [Nitrospinaceae bacterium]
MNKLFSRLKELFSQFVAELVRKGEKSPAAEEVPVRSPSELKILAEILKGTIQKNPKDIKALYNLGEVYMEMHRYGDAIPPLRELVKHFPDHKSGRLQLGRSQMEMGREEAALENLEEALRLDPESQLVKKALCQAHSNLSTAFGRIKNQKQAEHHFQAAIKIIPDFGPAHLSMGICYTEWGRYKDALAKIKEALKLDKNLTVEAHYRFGEVYTKLKDIKKAIKHYKESIAVDPSAAMPNLRLGMLYFKLKKYKDAVEPLRKSIKQSPKYAAEGYFRLGVSLMKLKRYKPAEEPLRKAVEVSPDNELVNDTLAENIYQLSTFLTGEEKPGEKIDLLREVVYFNPVHIAGYEQLSKAYDETLNGGKAITNAIIAQRLLLDNKMLKEAARSRESLNALYKKYKMSPDDFKKVITPSKNYH